MLAVSVEIGRWAATARTAMAAADAGARSGAVVLDAAAAYEGQVVLAPGDAEANARASALAYPSRSISDATAFATRDEVCVTVTADFDAGIGRVLGLSDREVRVTSCAAPASG
jgi:hypothetical protein